MNYEAQLGRDDAIGNDRGVPHRFLSVVLDASPAT
jgi:hypothetical protein